MVSIRETVERMKARAAEMELNPVAVARLEAQRKADEQNRVAWALTSARVPERIQKILLAGPKPTPAIGALHEWIRSGQTFLFLAGGVGTGKSVAAAFAIALRGGRWVKAIEVVRLGSFARDEIAQIRDAQFLALDDLGPEPLDAGGWGESSVLAILDERYDAEAPTIVTTNLTMEAFKARYGADGGRLLDRLKETGTWVNLTGESLRVAP